MALTPVTATRIGDAPLIHPGLSASIGDNINGPSVIRMPDWAPGLARYHIYFAHHMGKSIRLAYADQVQGPWRIHEPGALTLENSLFPVEIAPSIDQPAWAAASGTDGLYTHIASPDVHIDHDAQRIYMYFHGLLADGDQQTRLAISADGLHFQAQERLLGPAYFRAFCYNDWVYAIAFAGGLYRARDWAGPFQAGPNLIPFQLHHGQGKGVRHAHLHRAGDVLHAVWTQMGDRPELILHAQLKLTPDWNDWHLSESSAILTPARDWEGLSLPLMRSAIGAVTGPSRHLRDPCIFTDDDQTWMFYCGGGEAAIGLARLDGLSGVAI